ncbi:LysR family transcriptional regulator [Pseudomonas sp. MBLB4136]|uniref:LysR family transcriptional regulator n=1 Tax=Pseudomonas sp. MBLB4136 TaxID=3451558 RepID=UPI003F754E20
MDLQAIKTFLTLADLKRLSLCAEQLCLTKSAVSTRIKLLEEQLDQQLFTRSHEGMALTPAGRQFYQHAMALQQRWQRAKRELSQRDGNAGLLRLGAHPSLASDLLFKWGNALNRQAPELHLHLEADYSSEIVRQVSAGILDIGLIFVADSTAGLVVEQAGEDRLLMVANGATALAQVSVDNYLYIDWGWGYNAAHSERLPQLQNSRLSCGFAELGLPWLLDNGGAAYLPERQVGALLKDGTLSRVADAPEFNRPIFVTYARDALDAGLLQLALDALGGVIEGNRQPR